MVERFSNMICDCLRRHWGTIGLFVGASVLTVFEFSDFFILQVIIAGLSGDNMATENADK